MRYFETRKARIEIIPMIDIMGKFIHLTPTEVGEETVWLRVSAITRIVEAEHWTRVTCDSVEITVKERASSILNAIKPGGKRRKK